MDTPIDISGTELETRRLTLRPWRESDLDDFFGYASVPGVGEMAGWRHHQSLEESRRILALFISEKNVFAIVEKAGGKAIGSLGLHASWANENEALKGLNVKEIGYVLAREYWGKGLMPEAVLRVIDFCFNEIGLDALTVGHFESNGQSRRVIEKCGFTYHHQDIYHARQLNEDFADRRYLLMNPRLQAKEG